MRIVITSDLPLNKHNDSELGVLVEELSAAQPDVLILAGNLGGSASEIVEVFDMLSTIQCTKAAVFGNRDLWARAGQSSEALWGGILPGLLSRHGLVSLEHQNLLIDRVGICGSIVWYDYSGRDPQLKYTIEQYEELKGLVNEDAQNIDWPWSDQEFANQRHIELMTRLETLEHDRQVDHVVVVTHFPVFGEGLVRQSADQRWNFGMAYSFNLTAGRGIAPRSKVRHVVSGHIKNGGTWPVKFGPNVIQTHIIGHDGKHPRVVVINL